MLTAAASARLTAAASAMLTAAASAVIQVDKQMSKLEKAAAEGTVELLALTKPGKTTLPYKMTGTYIYMDEMGALKVRGHTM